MSNDSMIVLQCACGETYFAAERHAGGQIKCACGSFLTIARLSTETGYRVKVGVNTDFRPKKSAAGKSFLTRQSAGIVFGILCFAVALFAGYQAVFYSSNGETARTTTGALHSPSVSGKPASIAPPSTANYNGASSVPQIYKVPERVPVSLKNGSEIASPQGPRGNRTLKIINETDSDAVIKLVESATEKTRRFFYVRTHSTFTTRGIGTEQCRLRFTTGADWDAENRKFLSRAAYSEFETPLNFRRITHYTVSIKPSVTGNAPVDSIDEEKFAEK